MNYFLRGDLITVINIGSNLQQFNRSRFFETIDHISFQRISQINIKYIERNLSLRNNYMSSISCV